MKFLLNDLKNKFDFSLRRKFNFSRKNYDEKNEDKNGLFKDDSREKCLVEKYGLDWLKNNSTRLNYSENLYILDLLDRFLLSPLTLTLSPEGQGDKAPLRGAAKPPSKILDIGCKNWFYAKGEYFFFKKHCDAFKLNGIELDSNRLYTNFFSRAEVAKFHIKDLENTNYIEDDFLNHNEKYDYIIWILPFVFEYPHLKWGLPLSYFKPEVMLKHAYESLNEGGQIFIINQGEAEFEYQQKLCEKLKLTFNTIGKVESEFIKYKIERYLTKIKKTNLPTAAD